MVAPVEALVPIPEGLSDVEAAPLLCAGITTYTGLRHSGAMPGDLVAILGIGGVAQLGIQFAAKFGYNVVAIAHGAEKATLAKKLGASLYIDSKATNAAEALQKLGGAQAILATAPNSKAMSELFDGLGPNGKLIVIGVAFEPLEVTLLQFINGSRDIQGWASGTAAEEESEHVGVEPMSEKTAVAVSPIRGPQPITPNPFDLAPEKITFDVPCGPQISLERAQAAINAVIAEAEKRDWKMNVAVVDSGGNLVAFQRMNGAMLASLRSPSIRPAAAATFRRETKFFENGIGSTI